MDPWWSSGPFLQRPRDGWSAEHGRQLITRAPLSAISLTSDLEASWFHRAKGGRCRATRGERSHGCRRFDADSETPVQLTAAVGGFDANWRTEPSCLACHAQWCFAGALPCQGDPRVT